ncbi:hypothetical protein IDG65_14350, partial [Staphylococcus sp. EG-SA-17]|nr:hypothetical protein [Staphylococcus sp. EG-SA-17]
MFGISFTKKRKKDLRAAPRQRQFAAAKIDRLTESWRGITGSADTGVQMTLT